MGTVRAEDGRVEVLVTAPYQVAYDGQVYSHGKTVTVPVELAGRWVSNGWASLK